MTQKGVNINLVSRHHLEQMATPEKIRFLLDEVQKGNVLVLERGLTATEEAKLIEATMAEIKQDEFIGIEMQSYGAEKQNAWTKLLSGRKEPRPRMAVIGPANMLRTIHKDNQQIQAMVLAAEGIVTPPPAAGA